MVSRGECIDGSPNCESWALAGECEKNPGYMLTSCRKSCKTCPSPAPKKGAPPADLKTSTARKLAARAS